MEPLIYNLYRHTYNRYTKAGSGIQFEQELMVAGSESKNLYEKLPKTYEYISAIDKCHLGMYHTCSYTNIDGKVRSTKFSIMYTYFV